MSRSDTIGSHKTAVYMDSDGTLCVKYHDTIVWQRKPDGTVILDSGGWRTRTTSLRMNQAFRQYGYPYGVRQVKGEWFVYDHVTGRDVPYFDHMTVYSRNAAAA